MVWPAFQLRLEASGRELEVPNTVRKLAAVVLVTVTFNITAVAPLGASGLAPVTTRSRVVLAASGPPVLRVSRSRTGVTGVYAEAAADETAGAFGFAATGMTGSRAAPTTATITE
jgi:hypothetical protein